MEWDRAIGTPERVRSVLARTLRGALCWVEVALINDATAPFAKVRGALILPNVFAVKWRGRSSALPKKRGKIDESVGNRYRSREGANSVVGLK